MPQSIGTVLSGLESGIGSTVSGIENVANSLYNKLPSLSSLTGAATPNPSATLPATSITQDGGFLNVDPNTGLVAPDTGASLGIAPSGTVGANPPGATGAGAAPNAPSPNPLAAVAQAIEMYQRYNMQQNLQNPNYVAGQIAKLYRPPSKALVSGITKQVEAQAQERGLGGAPGLFQQALAEALAPYTFADQQIAEQEYFSALGQANQEYPAGGGYGDFSRELAAGSQAFGF
jgi:hypothetical protein